jgi:hypothetical protein
MQEKEPYRGSFFIGKLPGASVQLEMGKFNRDDISA